jgi:NAD-dependent dihydropyrimidine dehydrogenase PreA subunit
MRNATSASIGEIMIEGEEKTILINQTDPVIEHDCIWCMACVTVCPTQAIKVDETNLEVHKTTAAEITS